MRKVSMRGRREPSMAQASLGERVGIGKEPTEASREEAKGGNQNGNQGGNGNGQDGKGQSKGDGMTSQHEKEQPPPKVEAPSQGSAQTQVLG